MTTAWRLINLFVINMETIGGGEEIHSKGGRGPVRKDQFPFKKKSKKRKNPEPHPSDSQIPHPKLNKTPTREEVNEMLKQLPSDKAAGPDGITNRILQASGCSKCSSVMGLTKSAPDTGLRVTPMTPPQNSLAVGGVATCTVVSPQ